MEFTKILLFLETYRRSSGDWHAWSETHPRPTSLIGDQLKTAMPDRRPVGDQYASLETHHRPPCLIRVQHALLETHRKPTCLIRDPSETNIYDQRLLRDRHAWSENHWWPRASSKTDMPDSKPTLGKICISYGSSMGLWWVMSVSNRSLLRHVGHWWVSDEACWSLMGLQWGMLVSDEACWSPMRHVGLRWGMLVSDGSLIRHRGLRRVFDRSPIIIIFLWTQLNVVQ